MCSVVAVNTLNSLPILISCLKKFWITWISFSTAFIQKLFPSRFYFFQSLLSYRHRNWLTAGVCHIKSLSVSQRAELIPFCTGFEYEILTYYKLVICSLEMYIILNLLWYIREQVILINWMFIEEFYNVYTYLFTLDYVVGVRPGQVWCILPTEEDVGCLTERDDWMHW